MLESFCILFTCFFLVSGQADPCLPTTYQAIDHPWRSTSNIDTSGTQQCDSTLMVTWYRSTSGAGGTMPTTVPDSYACGTLYPIWMDDELPNTGETADVKICVRSAFASCQQTWNIRVKNCDTFYVYELQQAPLCPSAYCFGDKSPCPEGQTSDTGFTPCTDMSMNISGINLSPNVTADLVQTTIIYEFGPALAKVIEFQCNISLTSDLATFWFDVEWLINDNIVEIFSNVSYSAYSGTALQETSWTNIYRLGFLVKCGVRLKENLDIVPGPYTYSDPFYAGIQTDSPEYTVSETGTIEVTAWLTVPLGCSYLTSRTPQQINQIEENECDLNLKVRTPDYYTNGQLTCTPGGVTDEPISFGGTKQCGLKFRFIDRNEPQKFTIFGSGDNLANLNSRSIFLRMTTDLMFRHRAWSSASSPDIHVVVTDQDIDLENKFCAARTDPNLWTFDNRYWFYHQSGEYVLYKHDILPIKVHTVFDRCIWGGACVCGVAIRNGDALFVVNLCRSAVGAPWTSSATNTNHYIEQRACDNTHMTVETKGSDFYTITLSSGTVVTISIRTDINNTYVRYVQIKPSLSDWGASKGLCGILDGSIANDMQKRDGSIASSWSEFGSDWRLDTAVDGNSLFAVGVPLSDFPIPPLQYCRCRTNATNWFRLSDHVICDLDSTITSCAKVTETSSYFTQCDKAPLRRKKDTSSSSQTEPTKFGVVLDENYVNITEVYTWRNGWSVALAEQACRVAFNGDSLLNKCKDIVPRMSANIIASEEECVNDILVSANTYFLKDTVEALKTTCIVEATRSENLTTQGSGSEPGKTFLDELLELSCPNDCSGNGNCINGTCACNAGQYGDECSLQKTTPPVIKQTATTGLCKTDVTTCRSFVIPGLNFIDSQLTCRVTNIKVYSDRWERLPSTETFSANYLNSINCVCAIPSTKRKKRSAQSETVFAEGFLLSVSNDGVTFSDEITFITYDSTCYECNSSSISCTKLSSCSSSKTREDSDNVDTKDVLTHVLISVGTIIIVALVVAITIMCLKQKKQRARIGDSYTDIRQGPERVRYYNHPHEDQQSVRDVRQELDPAQFSISQYLSQRFGTDVGQEVLTSQFPVSHYLDHRSGTPGPLLIGDELPEKS